MPHPGAIVCLNTPVIGKDRSSQAVFEQTLMTNMVGLTE